MTSRPTNRSYPKREIRRSWRFFRFWTYWFGDRKVRAGLSLVLSDEAFGRLATLLKRGATSDGAKAHLTPWTRTREFPAAVAPEPRDISYVTLPSRVGHEDLDRLGQSLSNPDSAWTFVSTEGSDWVDVQRAAAIALSVASDFDLLYTDELYLDEDLPRARPVRVGPHTLLSGNVIGRHYLIRNSTARTAGGLRSEFRSASEFDLFLRMLDEGARFTRYDFLISTPAPHLEQADLLSATSAALSRRSLPSLRTESTSPGLVSWHVYSTEPARVDILIPTRDRLDLLRRCIEQIEHCTTYAHYTITILNNDSTDPETLAYLESTSHKVLDCPGAFNYARIINQGARESTAEFLVMLNNDTIVKTSNWLELLLGAALLDDVGVVGAKIVDQNNEVEHSGIAIAPYPQHIRFGVNIPTTWVEYSGIHNVSAVTGALHMISRVKWIELGGMDEELEVLLNDVDLCMRAELKGWHTVLQPAVSVQHFVSSSRGRLNPKFDRERFIAHWNLFRGYHDPYFPAACSLYANRLVFNSSVAQLFRWSEVTKALLGRN